VQACKFKVQGSGFRMWIKDVVLTVKSKGFRV
jgi:hypothetical protein